MLQHEFNCSQTTTSPSASARGTSEFPPTRERRGTKKPLRRLVSSLFAQNPMMFSCVFHEWIASISHFAHSSPFFWVFALNPEWMLINVLRVARCYHLGVFFHFFCWVSHTSSILDDRYEGNWCPNCVSQGEQKLPGLSGGICVSQPVNMVDGRRFARSNSWEVEGVSRKLLGEKAARLNTQLLLFFHYTGVTWILKMEGFEKGGFLSKKIIFSALLLFSAGAHFGSKTPTCMRPLAASGKIILVIWVSYLFVGKGKWSTANQKDIANISRLNHFVFFPAPEWVCLGQPRLCAATSPEDTLPQGTRLWCWVREAFNIGLVR